jgi:predicted aspartyl protease
MELRDWIGVGLMSSFISVLFALLFKTIPERNEQLIIYMLGQLSGFVATVVGYHYVTSVQDRDKAANTGKMADAIRAVAEGSATSTPTSADVTGHLELRPAAEDTTG